jgi:hypothetical protein
LPPHCGQPTTGIYDRHTYDAEKRAALMKWDRQVAEIVSGEAPQKVVELRA